LSKAFGFSFSNDLNFNRLGPAEESWNAKGCGPIHDLLPEPHPSRTSLSFFYFPLIRILEEMGALVCSLVHNPQIRL
jgi:hypothetical protein